MQPSIQVYSSTWCGYCRAAKQLLSTLGLDFEEVLVDREPELRHRIIERSGQRTVPQIWIGENHVGGYTDLLALHESGKLAKLVSQG